jgi:ABC-2 type transport system permease protein
MNIFKFELSMMKKSILIWSLAIAGFMMFYMSFYPLVAQDTAAFEQMLANFPEEFLAVFGMNPELPMLSLLGYFSLTFGIIQIPIAIQAANYGFHVLSIEERELTADFLMTKPVKRSQIFISKCLAAFTSLTIVNIVTWVATISILLMVKADSDPELGNVIVVLSSIAILQLVFFSIGLLISVSVKKIPSVLSLSMGLGFGLYVLGALGNMLSSEIFNFFSPYAHFNPANILIEGNYDWSMAIISIVVVLVALPMSYILYNKRNIASL